MIGQYLCEGEIAVLRKIIIKGRQLVNINLHPTTHLKVYVIVWSTSTLSNLFYTQHCHLCFLQRSNQDFGEDMFITYSWRHSSFNATCHMTIISDLITCT